MKKQEWLAMAYECGAQPTAPPTIRFSEAQFVAFCERFEREHTLSLIRTSAEYMELYHAQKADAALDSEAQIARVLHIERQQAGVSTQEPGTNQPELPTAQEISDFIIKNALVIVSDVVPPLAVQECGPGEWAIVDGKGKPAVARPRDEPEDDYTPFPSLLYAGLVAERIRWDFNALETRSYWITAPRDDGTFTKLEIPTNGT